jgi:hypothetical protein
MAGCNPYICIRIFELREEMGLRFRRSIRLLPGVRVNLGLTRASLSIGRRGLTYNIGSKGSRVTVGVPGSGFSYTHAVPHQNPVTLISNAIPSRKRFSATPLVIIAFVAGLLYLAAHSTDNKSSLPAPALKNVDIVGSITPGATDTGAVESAIPIPRPRPILRTDSVGPPLQIVPQR